MRTVLEVRGLSVRFGGLVAVDDLTLTLQSGDRMGLIGPNGAGKSTVLDALSGFVHYDGSVCVRGSSVDGLRPHQRVARGLARTFQSLELFEDLTVHENVAVSARDLAVTASTIEALGLTGVEDRAVAGLPSAMRRLVALARAVAAEPRVLLLDEPAAGMDGRERRALADNVVALASTGTAIVLVDHDLALVADVCDRVTVLAAGAVVATGTPNEVRRDRRVVDAYLGTR